MGMCLSAILETSRVNGALDRMAQLRALRLAAEAAGERAVTKRRPTKVKADTVWIDDVRRIVRTINQREFTLEEVYGYMDELEGLHPGAVADAQAAVRHNLQRLRDAGMLLFNGDGTYINLELERT